MAIDLEVLTIGHSTLSYQDFVQQLRDAKVTAIADVRSTPFSQYTPHFNRDTLPAELRQDKIAYVFLGEELGGRPNATQFFRDGIADYEKMSRADSFAVGLERVVEGAKKYRIALMCSEQDPLECHRCLLVGRALNQMGVTVRHILGGGKTVGHTAIEQQLLELTGRAAEDLFAPYAERLAFAYRERAVKVAYSEPKESPKDHVAAE